MYYVVLLYWVWKGGDVRLDSLKEFVDYVLCILFFEVLMCKVYGVGVIFVGYFVLEDVYMNVFVWVFWYLSFYV